MTWRRSLEITEYSPAFKKHGIHPLLECENRLEQLVRLHLEGLANQELLLELFPRCWEIRRDHQGIPRDVALSMFKMMTGPKGFYRNGRITRRPFRSRTLFRGSVAENKYGLSWTLDPNVAEHFANYRQPDYKQGKVWVAKVPPSNLLGYIQAEDEYLVDLNGIEHEVREATQKDIKSGIKKLSKQR